MVAKIGNIVFSCVWLEKVVLVQLIFVRENKHVEVYTLDKHFPQAI